MKYTASARITTPCAAGCRLLVLAFCRFFRHCRPRLIKSRDTMPHCAKLQSRREKLDVEDVLVLVPWSDKINIEHCMDALMTVPAAVHLGPEKIFTRFNDIAISRIGTAATLRLTRMPLTPLEVFAKRLFDVVVACAGMVVLTPMLLLIALGIKLETRGPVLFTQKPSRFQPETVPNCEVPQHDNRRRR